MKAAKARVCGVGVNVRIHFGELNRLAAFLAKNVNEVISDGISALVARMHDELLPTLHQFLSRVEPVPEETSYFPLNSTRTFSGVDQHFLKSWLCMRLGIPKPCVVRTA